MSSDIMLAAMIGFLASVIAAYAAPALRDGLVALLVRSFSWWPGKRKVRLSGQWVSTWHVESERFPSAVVDDSADVRLVGNRFYAKFKEDKCDCYLVGVLEQGRYITGTWHDETAGGYFGAFQFIIDPVSFHFKGRWVGFSTSGIVKEGLWEWERSQDPRSVAAVEGPTDV